MDSTQEILDCLASFFPDEPEERPGELLSQFPPGKPLVCFYPKGEGGFRVVRLLMAHPSITCYEDATGTITMALIMETPDLVPKLMPDIRDLDGVSPENGAETIVQESLF